MSKPDSEILHSSDYCKNLLKGLHSLHQDDLLCDLTLVTEGAEFRVHRVVLAASSDYFRALFTLDMKEKGQASITLKGVPAKGLKSVLNFIYSGKLACNLDNISEILVAATHLQQVETIRLCNSYLANLTTNRNCVDMYQLSESFGLNSVQDKAINLIFNHFEDIATSPEFYQFEAKFLNKILGSDKLRVTSELKLYELIVKWVKHDLPRRQAHLGELMTHVRFPLISAADLVTSVMQEQLMKNDPLCLELIFEANTYHMLPERQSLMQNKRTQVRTARHSIVMLDLDDGVDDGPRVFEIGTKSWGILGLPNIVDTFHAQVCTLANYMYICGGIELYSSNNPVSAKSYRYDPRFNSWCDITPMQEPRHHFVLTSDNHSLYAIGGYCNGVYKNVVEKYIVAEDRWIYCSPVGIKLSAASAAFHKGRVYVSGGQNDQGILQCMWCYTVSQDSWMAKPPMPQGRMDHAMCAYNNKLFILGGYDKNIIKAFDRDTILCFNIDCEQWVVVKTNCPKMSGICACLIESKVYVVGGFSYDENKKRKEIMSYNLDTAEWDVVAKIPSPAMSVPSCVLQLPRNLLRRVNSTV